MVVSDRASSEKGKKKKRMESREDHNLTVADNMNETGRILKLTKKGKNKESVPSGGIQEISKMTL